MKIVKIMGNLVYFRSIPLLLAVCSRFRKMKSAYAYDFH